MVVTTGFFDGVHLGHRHIIQTLVDTARSRGEESVIVTFWPHPRTVLQDDARNLRLLTTLEEKKRMILDMGVDHVEVVPFTKEFSSMTTEEYLRDFIVSHLGGKAILLGYDNRIGSNVLSHEATAQLAGQVGLEVILPPAVSDEDGRIISSTKIRAALSEGDVVSASKMLGYDYRLKGVVVSGNQLGRKIGFPTANMQLYEPLKAMPANGVYLVKVRVLDQDFWGMTNIGTRPTVSGSGSIAIETNIFDFDEDIYGLDIELTFLERIRDEKRFSGVDELTEQLGRDRILCGKKITVY